MELGWEDVAKAYDKIVGKEGHYFHQAIILPRLKTLLALESHPDAKLLDLGCGSGVLQQHIPKSVNYVGVDSSPSMIAIAKKERKGKFLVHDLTKPLDLKENDFTHATFILSLQNMSDPKVAIHNATRHLSPKGTLFIVLNHPVFRIPRQTSWGVDEEKKIQYRRIDRYLSPLSIPIAMHPSKKDRSEETVSHHFPVSTYINVLGELGLGVIHMEELISDKQSSGKYAKMENRAREEFPLFMLLVAKYV